MFWMAAALALQESGVRIQTLDNQEHRGSAAVLKLQDGVLSAVLTTPGGDRPLACDQIVEITFRPRAEPVPDPARVRLELTTGDVLFGTPADPPGEGKLALKTALLGDLTVEYRHVRWLGRPTESAAWPANPPGDRSMSHVYLASRETVQKARIDRIDAAQLQVTWKNRPLNYPLAEVAAVHFMTFGEPPAEGNGLVSVLELEDGSRLRGALAGLDAGGAKLTDLFGREHRLPAAAVRAVTFRNGRVIYLSDLTPVKVEENANYIRAAAPVPGDLLLPHRKDRNVIGGPLSLRGRAFSRGIGVHARSELTFELGGKFERFLATVGIDDSAGGRGHVVFEVHGDDQKLFGEAVSGAEAAREVTLEVSKVKLLRLVVDFGEDGGAGDRGDWAAARLIRAP